MRAKDARMDETPLEVQVAAIQKRLPEKKQAGGLGKLALARKNVEFSTPSSNPDSVAPREYDETFAASWGEQHRNEDGIAVARNSGCICFFIVDMRC